MIRRPPRSTPIKSSAASDVYKRQDIGYEGALQHLWNKDINYNEFLSQVKTLKQLNTNWYDLLFRTAFTHQHSVSITGGNERSDYYMSVGYADNQSVTIHEGLERYNVLARINTKINRNLQLGLKVSGALSKAKHPHSSICLLYTSPSPRDRG